MSSSSVSTLSRANHSHSIAIGNGLTKLLCLGLAHVSHVAAQPLKHHFGLGITSEEPPNADDFSLWLYLSIAAVLVLLGGAFAGLTIALMGQDGVYLQVIATSGEGTEQRHAQSVFNLLQKGKHWVLVTLLLSNVIVNESLPIVLDRSLGGGWPAVLGSTALIVIFGEVIPQSVCVRYGLLIGAYMAPFVLGLMWILAPIAWPIAKLLDRVLGKHHGTIYKKSGLKTLVTLHKTLGTSPTERLNQDEVTIISAVLDLKDKPVGDIMTPIDDVFTMSEDTVLDEETMNIILSAGYSRIPIYEPGNPKNFVGMLLVKILITYDPEDCKRVSEFALATLPETRPETSCLDIVNFFQEGKSHMVLVSLFPAENYGALGVVTLEDVIEELIGEEIIDESDVYIDVHKAIRRLAPAPKARVQKGHTFANTDHDPIQATENNVTELSVDHASLANLTNGVVPGESPGSPAFLATSPKTTFLRRSSGTGTERNAPVIVRGNVSDMREHLKYLGPSNLASRPKSTRYNTVKIKSGHPQPRSNSRSDSNTQHDWVLEEQYHDVVSEQPVQDASAPGGGERTRLLGFIGDADVCVDTCEQGYGSINRFISGRPPATLVCNDGPQDSSNHEVELKLAESLRDRHDSGNESRRSKDSLETIGSRYSEGCARKRKQTGIARSGSITENIIEAGGIQKLVLETNSSGEDGDQWKHSEGSDQTSSKSWPKPEGHLSSSLDGDEEPKRPSKSEETKKKRRRHRKEKSATKDVYETDPTAGE